MSLLDFLNALNTSNIHKELKLQREERERKEKEREQRKEEKRREKSPEYARMMDEIARQREEAEKKGARDAIIVMIILSVVAIFLVTLKYLIWG